MNTMKWLLRREFWEHKGALMWAPLVVGALMVVLMGTLAAVGVSQGKMGDSIKFEGGKESVADMIAHMPPEKLQNISDAISTGYIGLSAPLMLVMAIVIFFYCLASLSEERRDRSILFWKSLPVSDRETVLSKLATAALVAPLLTIAIAIVVALVMMLIFGLVLAFNGINMFGIVLSNSNFYLMPLRIIGLLPVYIVWALPTIGWLMMVSAWAKSKAFLWAVGTPIIAVVVVKWMQFLLGTSLNLDWLIQNVIARGLIGLFPGSWMSLANVDKAQLINPKDMFSPGLVFELSWGTLLHPAAWIGALVGAAMIFAAMRLRRWKDEG